MPRIDYQELKALSEEVTRLRQETVGYLKDYDDSNDAFTEDRELLGVSWSSGKRHHSQYKLVSDAIFNTLYDLDDSIKNYLAEFKNIVGEAENRLDTDELQELENELRRLQTQKLEFMEAMAVLFKDVPVLKEFFGNNSMIGRTKEIEILKRYEYFESSTQGSFDGVQETIHAILEGLSYLGQSKNFESGASGYQVVDISGSSWYKHLAGYNKANEEDRYEVRIIKTKYATIYQVLKNGQVQKKATADLQQSKVIESVEMMAQLTPELIKALLSIDDIEVLMDDGSTKVQKAGASFWILLSVLPPEKVKDILKSAKLAKNSGKALDGIHLTEKEWKQLKALDKAGDAIKVEKNIVKLSNKNINHMSKHIPETLKNQIPYLTEEQFILKLNENTFFNPKWTKDEIIKYTEQAYNEFKLQGKTGKLSYKVNDEYITIFIQPDGSFGSAYGHHKLTLNDFK